MNVSMSDPLNKILKMLGSLNKQELLLLNKAVVELSKTIRDQELAEASYSFNKGDIVSFMDKGYQAIWRGS